MTPLAVLAGLVAPACRGLGAEGIAVPPPGDLTRIARPPTPNHAFAGPAGPGRPTPDIATPAYPLGPDALFDRVRRLALHQPRTTLLAQEPDRRRCHVVVRSPLLNFPDLVSVQVDTGPAPRQALLMLYSRSIVGRYDFGVNRRRLAAWLAALSRMLSAPQPK